MSESALIPSDPTEPTDVVDVSVSSAMVRAAPGDVAEAIKEYHAIQKTLDAAMPDCIITIQRRKFRKKNYWRGVATAFNLRLELVSETSMAHDGGPDWGYVVVYRATAPNGRYADGDGSCFASEKAVYVWRDGNRTDEVDEIASKANATVHNLRSHAHTRAKNRAISDLVGFGEVSAEEVPHDPPAQRTSTSRSSGTARSSNPQRKLASDPQRKMLYAKSCARAESLLAWAASEKAKIVHEDVESLAGSIRKVAGEACELAHDEHGAVIYMDDVNQLVDCIEKAEVDGEGETIIHEGAF